MIGTNNLSSNTPEEIAEGIQTVVSRISEALPEAVILLQAILPRDPAATDPVRAKIKAINSTVASSMMGRT